MPQYQGVWTLEQQAQAQSNQQWVTDPNFKNTTLLLQADGTGSGSQNQTFLDGSTNNFFITRNGNTTQGSFSPFSQAPGYWGNYFTGTSGLTTNSNAGMGVTSGGDVTIEVWLNTLTTATNEGLGDSGNSICGTTDEAAWNSTSYGIILNSTGICLYNGNGGGVLWSMACSINDGKWHHVAVVRASGTWQTFIDGRSIGTTTTQGTRVLGSDTYKYAVGTVAPNGASGAFLGYLSNFRFTKAAVYTSAFTPQTTPFTAITNTTLLTCQSNRFVDNSSSPKTFTIYGSPSVQAFGPFAPALQWTSDVVGGSMYYDGTGDYLLTPSNAAFAMGTGQFCLEAWHYPTQNSAGGIILSSRTGSINQASSFTLMQYTGTTYSMYANGNHVLTTMTPFQWNHIIITRDSSNTLRLILNGVLGNYEASYVEDITQTTMGIGALTNGGEAGQGYTTGHRVIKGSIPTTYQTSSTTIGATIYTPPTQPVTLTSQGATSANVSYLSNYTNAGIYDGKMANNLETVGNAQVATSPVKYGSGSMAFDGTGDWLFINSSSASVNTLALGGGDFTVEMWLFPNLSYSGSYAGLLDSRTSADGAGLVYFGYTSTANQIGWKDNTTNVVTGTVTQSTWNHVAVARANGILRMFINGIQVSSGANTTNYTVAFKYIGSSFDPLAFNGFMDDLRITKGVARYIANFTPPQQALPRQ